MIAMMNDFRKFGDPMFKNHDPHICETTKKSEIKDDFGHTRFAVVLTDFDDLKHYVDNDDLRYKDRDFQVEVWSFCYSKEPLILVSKEFEKFEEADMFYHENIQIYVELCKAETRHYQDIHLYADKINYRPINYKCCENCKWCHKEANCNCHAHHPKPSRCECMNDKLFIADSIYDPAYDPIHHAKTGPHVYERFNFMPIHPEVEPTCVCDYWESKNEKIIA